MNIKEVFHILETEKFNTYFNNTSLYNSNVNKFKMFFGYFFIPEDEFYKTTSNSLFFIQLITSKKILDIEEVKMDIYNKIPDLTLSIKYLEPPEVIKEIKDNHDQRNATLPDVGLRLHVARQYRLATHQRRDVEMRPHGRRP